MKTLHGTIRTRKLKSGWVSYLHIKNRLTPGFITWPRKSREESVAIVLKIASDNCIELKEKQASFREVVRHGSRR